MSFSCCRSCCSEAESVPEGNLPEQRAFIELPKFPEISDGNEFHTAQSLRDVTHAASGVHIHYDVRDESQRSPREWEEAFEHVRALDSLTSIQLSLDAVDDAPNFLPDFSKLFKGKQFESIVIWAIDATSEPVIGSIVASIDFSHMKFFKIACECCPSTFLQMLNQSRVNEAFGNLQILELHFRSSIPIESSQWHLPSLEVLRLTVESESANLQLKQLLRLRLVELVARDGVVKFGKKANLLGKLVLRGDISASGNIDGVSYLELERNANPSAIIDQCKRLRQLGIYGDVSKPTRYQLPTIAISGESLEFLVLSHVAIKTILFTSNEPVKDVVLKEVTFETFPRLRVVNLALSYKDASVLGQIVGEPGFLDCSEMRGLALSTVKPLNMDELLMAATPVLKRLVKFATSGITPTLPEMPSLRILCLRSFSDVVHAATRILGDEHTGKLEELCFAKMDITIEQATPHLPILSRLCNRVFAPCQKPEVAAVDWVRGSHVLINYWFERLDVRPEISVPVIY